MSEDSLEPLVTQCPNCDTRFRVSESQLQTAAGRVRCGACLSVFDGTDHLILDAEDVAGDAFADVDALLAELDVGPPVREIDVPLPEPPAPEAVEEIIEPPDVADGIAALEAALMDDLRRAETQIETDQSDQQDIDEIAEPLGAVVAEPDEAADRRITVSLSDLRGADLRDELEGATPARSKRSRLTIIATLLLVFGLPAQILWFQFPSWVQQPQLRPVYEVACGLLSCELPPLRDVSLIESQRSVIRTHPDRSDARIIDVLMVNNADFDQPFPLIELQATSLDGQLIAGRRFEPQEYLQGELARSRMMPARTPVHVSLEIQDPGGDAMNFVVNFR